MVDALRGRARVVEILIAFALVYVIWGSTFLAIRIAIQHIPPLLMAGVRMAGAGVLLFAWAALRRTPWPNAIEWRNAAIVGLLLSGICNGAVTVSETRVPSGLAALLVGSIPLWMALFEAIGPRAVRPRPTALAGLALGFAGLLLLVGPRAAVAGGYPAAWALLPVVGAISWAWGSLWARRVAMPASPVLATAIGLTVGGALALVVGAASGELAHFEPARVTAASLAALAYLLVFGSIVGFTAYVFLLRHVSAAAVSTYAFVNPVIALLLGVGFAHERLGARELAAAGLVVVSVVLITTSRLRAAAPRAAAAAGANAPRVSR